MNRNTSHQAHPLPGLDLSGFPAVDAPELNVYRSFSLGRRLGFYSNLGVGRFDLSGEWGTMYFGDDLETAIRESLGGLAYGKAITGRAVDDRCVAETRLPINGPFAHVSARSAVRFGVIRELTTMPRYEIPQAWAQALKNAGFSGVRYPSRFTSAERANAWAVFGPAGPTDLVEVARISAREACAAAGIEVLDAPPPPRAAFTMLGDS